LVVSKELYGMAEKKHRRLNLAVWIAFVAALLSGMLGLARTSTEFAGRILEKRYPPPGRMISLGNYKLHLYCFGAGAPTVIVEPGMGQDWVGWHLVIPKLAGLHRVCVYDRAGYGWSDPGPKPRTALREAQELHLLLATAGVPEPYILVAHSFGGYIARIYASLFRKSLAGVVLVEPSHEDEPESTPAREYACLPCRILTWIPPLGIQRLKRLYEGYQAVPGDLKNQPQFYQSRYLVASSLVQLALERNEFDSLQFSEAQVRQAVFPRDLPMTVITALYPTRPAADNRVPEFPPIHQILQRRLAESSDFGKQIIARESGHLVPLDQPDLIANAILALSPGAEPRK
jgi:pimeloyl-ACP methyl ester carboxylesterase